MLHKIFIAIIASAFIIAGSVQAQTTEQKSTEPVGSGEQISTSRLRDIANSYKRATDTFTSGQAKAEELESRITEIGRGIDALPDPASLPAGKPRITAETEVLKKHVELGKAEDAHLTVLIDAGTQAYEELERIQRSMEAIRGNTGADDFGRQFERKIDQFGQLKNQLLRIHERLVRDPKNAALRRQYAALKDRADLSNTQLALMQRLSTMGGGDGWASAANAVANARAELRGVLVGLETKRNNVRLFLDLLSARTGQTIAKLFEFKAGGFTFGHNGEPAGEGFNRLKEFLLGPSAVAPDASATTDTDVPTLPSYPDYRR